MIARLGRAAGACVREMLDTLEVDCEYRRTGWMEVFRTPAALEHSRDTADTLRRCGYRVEELAPNDLLEREPAFLPGLAGALHYTNGGYANPRRLITGLARGVTDLGVELLAGEEAREIRLRDGRVEGVATERGRWIEGDSLVLAAGPWTSRLARSIGVRVPMQAGKGYHVNLRGIPAMRFLDHAVVTGEAEVRWNVTNRWAAILFAGVGYTGEAFSDLDSGPLPAAGIGFRYHLARKLGLWAGLDFAKSEEDEAVYITVGNAWLR